MTHMKKYAAFILSAALLFALAGCAGNTDNTAGAVTFYSEPVWEKKVFDESVTVGCRVEITEEQADNIKTFLNNADEWYDDDMVNRLAFYFDGEFEFTDAEFVYYFTYEDNLIYYDHYFAYISAEGMQYIKDLSADS